MEAGPALRSERLLLRRWRDTDLEPFAEMNADPAVMEYFSAALSRTESAALVERIEDCFERRGYGLWAVELTADGAFVGFTGLTPVSDELAFAPAVELGWRLAHAYWGRGIATEAAATAARFAFDALGLPSLLAYTAAGNLRSRRVMERLGMRHEAIEDFVHPTLPSGHPLAPHVLYRLDAHARP